MVYLTKIACGYSFLLLAMILDQNFKISLKIFTGNTDRNSIVSQSLSPDNYTHYIRIHPLSWNESIAMRVEVYGCYEGMLVVSCFLN